MCSDSPPPRKYHSESNKHQNSCPFWCTIIAGNPRLGRVNHTEIPMPRSLIKKAPVSEIDLEIMRNLWRNFKW